LFFLSEFPDPGESDSQSMVFEGMDAGKISRCGQTQSSGIYEPNLEPSPMILDAVAGCALRNFGITQLKNFQIRTITSILKKEDVLVVSGTGSGKSICYQIPSVMATGITLLVVPTIALRKDQVDFLLSHDINSFALGEKTTAVEYDQQLTAISSLSESKPVILVGTPETFMGREGSLGFVRRHRPLLDRRLKLVVFDECHLIYEWCGFRNSFLELKTLRSCFTQATFLALTATLLPKDEKLIIEEFLPNPCVVRMSVNRPNVRLKISHYNLPLGSVGSADWVGSWFKIAKGIVETVNGQLAIVYFSYAREANAACSAISNLGVKAAAFTGECSSLDKNHIHAAMRNGEIEILCATTAYGCGLNLPDVCCVIRFGLPKNMSSWMQEQGRAGRDGQPARAIVLLNEKYDINRCVFWLDGLSDEEKNQCFLTLWMF
jgi:ATP-dependent DNA helicase RecQ